MGEARTAMRARNARKWLVLRGLWRGRGRILLKNPVPNVSRLGPERSRVGPALVRAEGGRREDVKRDERAEGARWT